MRSSTLLLASSAALISAESAQERHLGWRNGAALYTPQGAPTPKYPHPYKSIQAAPLPTDTANKPSPNPAYASACASVSELAASATNAQPSATPTVPAQLAYECMASVPFNQSAARKSFSVSFVFNWQRCWTVRRCLVELLVNWLWQSHFARRFGEFDRWVLI